MGVGWGRMESNSNNKWLRRVLERLEDHVIAQRKFNAEQRKFNAEQGKFNAEQGKFNAGLRQYMEKSDRRWEANQKIIRHLLEEIKSIKRRRS